MRRFKGAVMAVLRGLLVAVTIALTILVLQILVGVILVQGDALFR